MTFLFDLLAMLGDAAAQPAIALVCMLLVGLAGIGAGWAARGRHDALDEAPHALPDAGDTHAAMAPMRTADARLIEAQTLHLHRLAQSIPAPLANYSRGTGTTTAPRVRASSTPLRASFDSRKQTTTS